MRWLRNVMLAIVGLGIAAMALCPPWERVAATGQGAVITRPAGYSWIFAPPPASSSGLSARPGPVRDEIRWFDYQSARDAGYGDEEIARFLSGEQQRGIKVFISTQDYEAYTPGKRDDPKTNAAAIAPHVKPRPLEENIAASKVPASRDDDLPGIKGVRIDLARLLVQLLGAAGVAVFALMLGGGPTSREAERAP